MPGKLKIGRTSRDTRARARELSTTAVPGRYQVAFDVFAEDSETLEHKVHTALEDFRVDRNREFFEYPLDKAIRLLLDLVEPATDRLSGYVSEDIMERLIERYGKLSPDIVAVRIVQTLGRVWLEVTWETEQAGYLRNQTIARSDLAFITDHAFQEDDLAFPPSKSVSENASRFVESDSALVVPVDLFGGIDNGTKGKRREHFPNF